MKFVKSCAVVAAFAVVFALVAPSTAQAKDLSGRFGIGGDSSLGWSAQTVSGAMNPGGVFGGEVPNTGLSLVFYVSKMFGIQLITGAEFTTVTGDNDAEYSANLINVAVRGIIPIAFTNEVNLGAVLGFSGKFGFDDNGNDIDDDDLSANWVSFDLGVRPEWFITDHFSIHTQLGLSISLLNEDNYSIGAGGESGVDINVFNNVDLLGNAGFTFWF